MVASDARRPALRGGFDRVLADLPCSGSGILRKHPELKWRIRSEELDRLTAAASDMLGGLLSLVRPGGLLVVSTCSIEPEENEDQVTRLLERHPDLAPVDLEGRLPPGFDTALETPARWRLLPDAEHDGFTVHVLARSHRTSR